MTEDSKRRLAERRGEETSVYQPAADSALLVDAVTDRLDRTDRVLEVGTGSGWVAARFAETGASVYASDVNPHACGSATDRGLPAICGNLLDPFRAGAFDVVAFNPPYLPTDPDAEWDDWMEHALSGGPDGRRLVVPFLEGLGRVLAPGGVGYLLISSLTGYDAVESIANANGLALRTIREESYPFETLFVLELTPSA
ncbi:MAG: HemK2/MTQ2 family protein methyltransferase [Halobacteriota archaeon]